MEIVWAGQTTGRIKFNKIDWRCDCGRPNTSTDPENWDRVMKCWHCGARYELEFRQMPDAISPAEHAQ